MVANEPERAHQPSVFLSYSRADRARVSGLGLLLEALGHRVFVDHKTILPGAQWQAKLQEGLDEADILLVYWTKHAASSKWVRKEYEHFHVRHPERPLVPMIGDETPPSELLSARQSASLFPLVNELLALKQNLEKQGAKQPQIQLAILERLEEAGVKIEPSHRKKLLALFAPGGILGLIAAPAALLQWLGNAGLEAVAHLSAIQAGVVVAAAVSGVVVCSTVDTLTSAKAAPVEASTPALPSEKAGEQPHPTAPNRSGGLVGALQNVTNQIGSSTSNNEPEPTGDCARVTCDCENLEAGILTGPWRDQCRQEEVALKRKCAAEGSVSQPCSMSGPNPWPPE